VLERYRVTSTDIFSIGSGSQALPGRRVSTLWSGDHIPSVAEFREIAVAQTATEGLLSNPDTHAQAEEMIAKIVGKHQNLPFHGPLIVEKRRPGRVFGHRALGRVTIDNLLINTTGEMELEPLPHAPQGLRYLCELYQQVQEQRSRE
jgi:hypothetical protein